MKIKNLIKPLMFTASVLFVACTGDEILPAPDDTTDGVSLSLSCAEKGTISRATPGQDMPFVEYGNDYEYRIDDAVIVIYTHPINSGQGTVAAVVKLNSSDLGEGQRQWGSTPADNSYYDNDGVKRTVSNAVTYITGRKHEVKDNSDLNKVITHDLTPGQTYYAMAFANFGNELTADSDPLVYQGMNETDLRDMVYTGPLFTDNSYYPAQPTGATGSAITGYDVHREYSHFAMSAINEVKFTAPDIDMRNTPFNLGDFYVQRLAARIDICFGVQAVQYDDYAEAGGNRIGMMLHYVHMKWEDFQVDYNPSWKGLFKYDMDVPSASVTGYPPGGLYRFPIYDENEYQRNKVTEGENFAEDHGESVHRLPNDTWFWLENIEILNAVNRGEYLLEHSRGTPRYMGHEGSWTNGYPENFIESPDVSFGGRPLYGRYIGDRNLTPEPDGSPTKSNTDLRDENRIKVRPVPYIQSMLTGTNDAKHTIQEYHAYWDANQSSAPYRDFDRKFHVSSILAYVGENTYDTYDDGNQYTAIRLTGKTNMATAFTGTTETYHTMTVTMLLRHSYGTPNLGQPLCYGVVRNTIYKVFLRFFGEGENLYVRYWYYNGDYDRQQYNMNDVPYGETAFSKYIVESNGQQGAD